MGSGCPRRLLSESELEERRQAFRDRVAKKSELLKAIIVDAVNKLTSALCPQNLNNILRFVLTKTKDDYRFGYSNGIGIDSGVEDFVVDEQSVVAAISMLISEEKLRLAQHNNEFVFVKVK